MWYSGERDDGSWLTLKVLAQEVLDSTRSSCLSLVLSSQGLSSLKKASSPLTATSSLSSCLGVAGIYLEVDRSVWVFFWAAFCILSEGSYTCAIML